MDKNTLTIYRRRYIPDEFIKLTGNPEGEAAVNDEILYLDDEVLVTRWSSIHPRSDFSGGISAFYLKKGWKISKILDHQGNLLHWYCDIVDYVLDETNNAITCEDLLFDVVITPSGKVKVLDCDEAAEAFEKELITNKQLTHALKAMHELLEVIYRSRFDRIETFIDSFSQQ